MFLSLLVQTQHVSLLTILFTYKSLKWLLFFSLILLGVKVTFPLLLDALRSFEIFFFIFLPIISMNQIQHLLYSIILTINQCLNHFSLLFRLTIPILTFHIILTSAKVNSYMPILTSIFFQIIFIIKMSVSCPFIQITAWSILTRSGRWWVGMGVDSTNLEALPELRHRLRYSPGENDRHFC